MGGFFVSRNWHFGLYNTLCAYMGVLKSWRIPSRRHGCFNTKSWSWEMSSHHLMEWLPRFSHSKLGFFMWSFQRVLYTSLHQINTQIFRIGNHGRLNWPKINNIILRLDLCTGRSLQIAGWPTSELGYAFWVLRMVGTLMVRWIKMDQVLDEKASTMGWFHTQKSD